MKGECGYDFSAPMHNNYQHQTGYDDMVFPERTKMY